LEIGLYDSRTLQPRGVWTASSELLPVGKLNDRMDATPIKGRVVDIISQSGWVLLLGHFNVVRYKFKSLN
jgi:hypothetical protein